MFFPIFFLGLCIMKMWNIILVSYHHLVDTQRKIFSYHTWNDDYILNPSSWNFYGMCTHTHPYILMLMMFCRLSFHPVISEYIPDQMILTVKYKSIVKKQCKWSYVASSLWDFTNLIIYYLTNLQLEKVSSLFTISHTIALNWPGIKP